LDAPDNFAFGNTTQCCTRFAVTWAVLFGSVDAAQTDADALAPIRGKARLRPDGTERGPRGRRFS
jgi:hypothetical protein